MAKNKVYSPAQINEAYTKFEKAHQKKRRAERKIRRYHDKFCDIVINNLAEVLKVPSKNVYRSVLDLMNKVGSNSISEQASNQIQSLQKQVQDLKNRKPQTTSDVLKSNENLMDELNKANNFNDKLTKKNGKLQNKLEKAHELLMDHHINYGDNQDSQPDNNSDNQPQL